MGGREARPLTPREIVRLTVLCTLGWHSVRTCATVSGLHNHCKMS